MKATRLSRLKQETTEFLNSETSSQLLTGKEYGMQTLDQSLLTAIQAKEIDPDHAFLFANDKKQFARFVTDKSVLPTVDLAPG